VCQGEYVAAEKIENVLLKSLLVAQIFVYGDSFHHCLVAVAGKILLVSFHSAFKGMVTDI
jgi:long-subunit acyl-CoA synthetase (AMP-forming)